MRLKTALCFMVTMLVALAMVFCPRAALADTLIFASAQDEADHYYRQSNGAYDVVEMYSLVQDYQNQVIDESAFLLELWQEHTALMVSLVEAHEGSTLTPCLLMDLVFAQANSAIGADDLGNPVYFDTQQFLDITGQIAEGNAKAYNTARRANGILQELKSEWELVACPMIEVNHKCCKCPVLCNCNTEMTNGRCAVTDGNLNCARGAHHCPDVQ